MTNNPSNQPFEPFQVQSNLLKSAGQGGPERPGAGAAEESKSFWNKSLGNWDAGWARWLALPLFALIYAVTQQHPDLQPVTLFVLLACLLFRMEPRDRQLAGAPLTLATFRLAYQMTLVARPTLGSTQILPPQVRESWMGMPWVPLFLAICIFYLPRKATVTGKIIVVGAICMLISGLLPGGGYVAIFAMIQYTLFVGVVAGLIADHTSNSNGGRAVHAAR
jgi:hypothetical protein